MAPPEHSFRDALEEGNHQRAGEWLVHAFASEVFGLCYAYVQNGATAEDLSQEVFAKAFAGLGGYRGEASARTWLLKIARNRCIDHLRAHQRWVSVDDEADPDEHAEEVSLPASILARRADVESALHGLDEGERAIVVLRFRNGLSYQELAAAFGIKVGTARMRVSRALTKMRSLLEAPTLGGAAPGAAAPAPASMPAPARSLRMAAPPAPAEMDLEEAAFDALEDSALEESAADEEELEGVAPPAAASAAPSMAPPEAPRAKSRLAGLFRRKRSETGAQRPAAPPPAPAAPRAPAPAPAVSEHVLERYFASESQGVAASLRTRLAGLVAKLPTSS